MHAKYKTNHISEATGKNYTADRQKDRDQKQCQRQGESGYTVTG